jgi:hypothetical protein
MRSFAAAPRDWTQYRNVQPPWGGSFWFRKVEPR